MEEAAGNKWEQRNVASGAVRATHFWTFEEVAAVCSPARNICLASLFIYDRTFFFWSKKQNQKSQPC